jgi:predicted phage terminase large subunit-like protein
LNTFDFTTEAIERIEPAGTWEVFDIQVERTGNFIANGLVSHNTRWHEDDLAGRILSSEDAKEWTVVCLPAEAETGDPLGRAEGQALCPERFDLAALADIKRVLGSNRYAALYQQRPVPAEGGMFKRAWFGDPLDAFVPAGRLVRFWDNAATDGGGDYTAGVLVSRQQDRFHVVDVVRGQWSPGKRDDQILRTAKDDQARYGNVRYLCEQEPGSAGVSAVSTFVKLLVGFSAHGRVASGDKELRAGPFAAQVEGGNVKLVRGVWVPAYLDELCSFPQGTHDDQVDASSGAFNELAGGKSRNPISW